MHPEPYKGFSAYDKSLHTYTPFSTESDAMLASLLLALEIPRSTMDFILSIINNKGFDTSKVTLKSSTDIYAISETTRISNLQAIAVNRELVAAHEPPFRTRPRNCTSSTVNLPSNVMENVMDFIHAERDISLDYVRHRQCSKVHDLLPSERGADLLNMSLVHRTWTFSAQQTLGRIACIEVPGALDNFLRSPCFGPWTREIILTVGMTESNYGDGPHALDLLQRFLLRFQNLRSLTLKIGPYGRNWVRDLGAEILRRNTYLRTVSIQTFNGADFHLSPALDILNGLRDLDSVEIGDCMAHGLALALEQFGAQPASTSPRAVSMTLLNHKDEKRLQALVSSNRDNRLLSLSLQFGHGRFSHFSFDPRRIAHIFRDLQELRFPPRDTERLAEILIPLCPTLRKLHLDLQPASNSDYLEELQQLFPSSLEHLGFHFVNTQLNEGKDMAGWDAQISELLSGKRLAALRSVEVEAPRFYEASKLIQSLRRKDESRQTSEARLRERSCSLFPRTRQASTESKIQLCLELCQYES